jgi:cytochrome c biogenesis protein CcdA
MGLLMTAGFLVIFAGFGLAISAGLRVIIRFLPFASLVVGGALVLLGGWLLLGKSIPLSLPQPSVNLQARNKKSVFVFGVAYGVASLSCTLPVFLAVVGVGLATANFASTFVMFLTYGLGMAIVLMGVAIGAALFKGSVSEWFRGVLPYVNRVGAALLIVAGLYLLWYQGRYLPLIVAGL